MHSKTSLEKLSLLVRQTLAGADGFEALRQLEEANQQLKEAFDGDPSMAFTGDLFQVADALNEQAKALAGEFAHRGQGEYEERAWQLRCSPVLTAYTHRRNIVGPVMLDWANCNRRLGNTEKADEIYDLVINDLKEVLGWGPSFNEDWLSTVESLQQALANSNRDYGDLVDYTRRMLEDSRKLSAPTLTNLP